MTSTPPFVAPLNPLIQAIRARPRLIGSFAVGVLLVRYLPPQWASQLLTRLLVAWDAGVCLYLLLVLWMIFGSSHEKMRQRAQQEDAGKYLVLALVVLSSIASLAAIGAQLAVVRDMHGIERYPHLALAGLTIVSSWLFTHIMFALHYAHDYYQAVARGHSGGVVFPGDEPPLYGDFLYFSCVIGTSGQTADVSFASRHMRGIGTLHCILAFFFNTTILALTINIAAGLF